MLKTGAEYLESIRDGRALYLADERIEDVTAHPAFRGAARTWAALYDLKCRSELREFMSYEEDGERYSMYFLRPRNREDLIRRTKAHAARISRVRASGARCIPVRTARVTSSWVSMILLGPIWLGSAAPSAWCSAARRSSRAAKRSV